MFYVILKIKYFNPVTNHLFFNYVSNQINLKNRKSNILIKLLIKTLIAL